MFGWKLIFIISFQDELIKAITARSARQRSSEYSDDFDSDEIGMCEYGKVKTFSLFASLVAFSPSLQKQSLMLK